MEWLCDRNGSNLGTDLFGEADTLLDGLGGEVRPIGRDQDVVVCPFPRQTKLISVGYARGRTPLRHSEVMRLMHGTADQEADKPEPANVRDFLRVSRRDGKKFPIRQWGSFSTPALTTIHGLRPGGDHPLDRDERAPGAKDGDL
jgi:hypothetical protein